MHVEEAIRQSLGDSTQLGSLLSNRIYPGDIPDDDSPPPWILFYIEEELPDDSLDSQDWQTCTAVVEAYSQTYSIMMELRKLVRSSLSGLTGIYYSEWIRTGYQKVDSGHNATFEFKIRRTKLGVVTAGNVCLTCRGSFILVRS